MRQPWLLVTILACAGEPAAPPASAPRATTTPSASHAPAEDDARGCGPGMVLIPGGRYAMRTHARSVEVKPFCLDALEATVAEYAGCLRAGRCTQARPSACNGPTIDFEGKDGHPIVCIDFAQAEAYCAYRDKRLPLDEEWEWAARGGRKGTPFPWGTAPPSRQLCWSGTSERRETCPVGIHADGANPWGVQDLAGNVLEWTATRADAGLTERSARGGSWRDRAREQVRAARPGWLEPGYRSAFLGVRCAADIQP